MSDASRFPPAGLSSDHQIPTLHRRVQVSSASAPIDRLRRAASWGRWCLAERQWQLCVSALLSCWPKPFSASLGPLNDRSLRTLNLDLVWDRTLYATAAYSDQEDYTNSLIWIHTCTIRNATFSYIANSTPATFYHYLERRRLTSINKLKLKIRCNYCIRACREITKH